MEDLEREALERFSHEVPFYYKYVDDIVTAVPNHLINEFLSSFNSLHPRIQFTLKVEGKRLNFLDVTIINSYRKLEFNVFHKAIFSE